MKTKLLMPLVLILSSCSQNLIEATQPKPAKTIVQAKARLVAADKWVIDGLFLNDIEILANGQIEGADVPFDIEWLSFKEDGGFEIKLKDEPLESSLKYKIDQNAQKLTIYDPENEKVFFADWSIEAGSVYTKFFEMSLSSEEGEGKLKVKMRKI